MLEQMAKLGIPGMSAAVAIDGEIVWAEGLGYADLENRVPAWPTTLYRIGSISKPLTAAAVALLVEQRRLDLDAPIQRYVPSFPDKGHPITTRQLAGHLAGIRHYQRRESIDAGQRHYDDVVDALEIFQDDPLVAPPGDRYSYSTFGFNLISAVVQGASGQDFVEFMQEHVFDPLGMRHTHADAPSRVIPRRTRFYSPSENGAVNSPFVDNSYKWAGGGFLSTVEDLVQFGSAHLAAGFLRASTLDLLFTSQETSSGEDTGYGIGWQIAVTDFGEGRNYRTLFHGGSSVGGRAILMLVPDADLVMAALVNFDRFEAGATASAIAAPFMGR